MKYGLIGEKLPHSFSKEIHERIADYSYELCELSPDSVDSFMRAKDFSAVNVTIPYKQTVIPYLDRIDPAAEAIGAVNTIVNRDGKLYGYNTDYFGMSEIIRRLKLDLEGKSVLILGTGGTSRTARAVAEDMGAGEIITVGRRGGDGVITYAEACERYACADVIINTTPCGMFPNHNGTDSVPASPLDISKFTALSGVVDAVYNPLRTNLVIDASERGIPAEGGLYMLVAQAVRASEYFTGTKLPEDICQKVYGEIRSAKENIILTGMPGCGKSTVGKRLAERLGRVFIDTDDEIVKTAGKPIPEIFAEAGEAGFRDVETDVIRRVTSEYTGAVISTGGGAVLIDENVRMLKRCGVIFFINRPLEEIKPTSDRPLSSDYDALKRRFDERYDRYVSTASYEIRTDGVVEHTCNRVANIFLDN